MASNLVCQMPHQNKEETLLLSEPHCLVTEVHSMFRVHYAGHAMLKNTMYMMLQCSGYKDITKGLTHLNLACS